MEIAVGYVLIFFILAAVLGYFVILSDSAFGNLDFTSSRVVAKKVIEILRTQNLNNRNFYDLGSAKGSFSIKIAKAFPGLLVYGVDDNKFRIFYSKLAGRFLKNLKFIKGEIFVSDVSTADIVYLYLPQELMPALQIKLQKELKPGAMVISNSVSFNSWAPSQTFSIKKNKLFIYQQI